jgi:hypothetical protein
VLTWFNSHSVRDVYENQKRIFELLNLHIDCYFDERLTHSGFMEYSLLNFDSDIFLFFDLDCIPINREIYFTIVKELNSEECIIGIEQSANHLNPDFIYAGPACFAITKNLYDKLEKPSFAGNSRSDIAQEISYICREKNIKIKFFELISSKNSKWKLGRNKFFGNGSLYKLGSDFVYHQFQINIPEQKNDFFEECKKISQKL